MKKLLDIFVLSLIVIFLIILFQRSVIGNEHQQIVIPNARMIKNIYGGYDYYVKGRKVGYSRKNIHGSYDVYIHNRLKYRGIKFNNTRSTRYYSNQHAYNMLYNHQRYYGSRTQIRSQKRSDYLKTWTAKRKAEHPNRVKWWEIGRE